MNVDELKIKEKLVFGDRYVNLIKETTAGGVETFSNSIDVQLKGERLFEIISQVILDICTHIVSRTNLVHPPDSYASCMKKLGELGILGQEEVTTFTELIKMRNLISHNYSSIDVKAVFNGLQKITGDYGLFKEKVLAWLETQDERRGQKPGL